MLPSPLPAPGHGLSERGLQPGTRGVAGALWSSSRGRTIRAGRGEGAELRRNPEGLGKPGGQPLPASLGSSPIAPCSSSSRLTCNFCPRLPWFAVSTFPSSCALCARNLILSFPVRFRAPSGLVRAGICRTFKSYLKYMTENLKPALKMFIIRGLPFSFTLPPVSREEIYDRH